MNITRQNAAQVCIAEAATRKATCTVHTRNIAQPFAEVQKLAALSGVTATKIDNQIHFTYVTPRSPITDL